MGHSELIARIGATYGGGEWLIEAPFALLRALAEELPRMQAEESLRRVAIAAIAGGTAKKSMRDRMLSTWHRIAGGRKAIARVRTAEEFAAMAADLNIEFTKVKAP